MQLYGKVKNTLTGTIRNGSPLNLWVGLAVMVEVDPIGRIHHGPHLHLMIKTQTMITILRLSERVPTEGVGKGATTTSFMVAGVAKVATTKIIMVVLIMLCRIFL